MASETRTSIPRIRAVRFKNGGEVRLLASSRETNAQKTFQDLTYVVDWYRKANQYGNDLAGYVVFVWDTQGRSNCSLRNAATSPFARDQLPTIVAERVRRRICESDAMDIVNYALGFPKEDA